MRVANNAEQLTNTAISVFAEDVLNELKDWYRYTLQGRWKYVVFTVRRSYILALIMEEITGEKMYSDSTEYLTDAAFYLRCRDLADEYREYQRFSKILLCDDALIHGRNMNHMIECIQAEVIRLLGDKYEAYKIQSALIKAVEIHVYTRVSGSLLLKGAYEWNLHYIRKEPPEFLHQLSNDIASLISRANITNACYIYTEYLSEAQMQEIKTKLNEDGFLLTYCQNVKQFSKFVYIGSGSQIRAVLSIRIIKNVRSEGYRAAPFVFLPNLNEEETDALSAVITEKLPVQYKEWFLELGKLEGKRTYNEMISLIFSDAVLKDFNQKYQIIQDRDDQEKELEKLARNYNRFGFESTMQFLRYLLCGTSLLSVEDILTAVSDTMREDRAVLYLEKGQNGVLLEKEKIRQRVEDYFYERGCVDERSACELLQMPYFPTEDRAKRRARGCCFTLTELNQGYTKQESEYCMAYFLQMIDAGIGSLSSYAPNHVKVIGFAQYAKAGEQSLQIAPLRFYKFMPMLARMEFECSRHFRSSLTDEIQRYGKTAGWEKEQIADLIDFVRCLARIGHSPSDWNGNYIDKVDAEEGKERELFAYLNEQYQLRESYVEYAKSIYAEYQ